MGGMDPTMMMGSVCCILIVSAAVLLFVMQSRKSAEAAAVAAQLQTQARLAEEAMYASTTSPAVPVGGSASTGDANWDIAANGEKDSTDATDAPDSTKAGKKAKKAKKNDKKAAKVAKGANKTKTGKKKIVKTKTPAPTPPGASTLKNLNATTIRQTWSDGTVRDWKVGK